MTTETLPTSTTANNASSSPATNWRLVKAILWPYWVSEEKWRARGYWLLILSFVIALVTINVWLNEWNRLFYDALEKRDYNAFKEQLWRFTYLAFAYIALAVYRILLEQKLQIMWRRWLTDRYLNRWLADARFYEMGLTQGEVDNPDQRIAEDIAQVVNSTLSLGFSFIRNAITLVSFSVILWTISGVLDVEFMNTIWHLPGYMFWFSIAYAVAGSYLIYWLGRQLVPLNYIQQKVEANFRFALIRVREYAESIALYATFRAGLKSALHAPANNNLAPSLADAELSRLKNLFTPIISNWHRLITVTKRLNVGSNFYGQFANIFPILVSAPRYFRGEMTLGNLFQVSSAFGSVQDAMSWFINLFSSLAEWKAALNRLTLFEEKLQDKPHSRLHHVSLDSSGQPMTVTAGNAQQAVTPTTPSVAPAGSSQTLFSVNQLIVASPLKDLTVALQFELTPGQRILLQGPSGCGKSTLLRTLSGIYPYGNGTIARRDNLRVLFVPQKMYLPSGSLRTALCYPLLPSDVADATLDAALTQCNASAWRDQLDTEANWIGQLSLGEQQRLAFVRMLLLQPDVLFLDEVSSSLDEASELQLYKTLFAHLPAHTTVVSIGHRSSLASLHQMHWRMAANDAGLFDLHRASLN